MTKHLVSEEKVPLASGEDTHGLEVIRKVFLDEEGRSEIRWQYRLPDGVAVIGFTKDMQVVAIEEWQPGAGIYVHLIGGAIEPGEEAFIAARREFREETGYEAGSLALLSSIFENTSKSDRRIWCFLALNCVKVAEPEPRITVKLFDPPGFWLFLMDYLMGNPVVVHGGGNSLKVAALAYHDLGLFVLKEGREWKAQS